MKIKKILTTLIIAATFIGTTFFTACSDLNSNGLETGSVNLETETDSLSYAYGVMVALNTMNRLPKDEIEDKAFFKGVMDAYKDKTLLIDDKAALNVIKSYNVNKRNKNSEKNLLAGKAFLDANKTKEGVVTLPSGLQYKILKEGNGPIPKATDKVKTHYHGSLIDGTVFDSSVDRGQPLSFGVTKVIRGWTEALQLMPVGSKWKLFIPQDLAYGANGAGGKIGPHATLIFEVELLAIEDPTESTKK